MACKVSDKSDLCNRCLQLEVVYRPSFVFGDVNLGMMSGRTQQQESGCSTSSVGTVSDG